jgi:hypothetical protein
MSGKLISKVWTRFVHYRMSRMLRQPTPAVARVLGRLSGAYEDHPWAHFREVAARAMAGYAGILASGRAFAEAGEIYHSTFQKFRRDDDVAVWGYASFACSRWVLCLASLPDPLSAKGALLEMVEEYSENDRDAIQELLDLACRNVLPPWLLKPSEKACISSDLGYQSAVGEIVTLKLRPLIPKIWFGIFLLLACGFVQWRIGFPHSVGHYAFLAMFLYFGTRFVSFVREYRFWKRRIREIYNITADSLKRLRQSHYTALKVWLRHAAFGSPCCLYLWNFALGALKGKLDTEFIPSIDPEIRAQEHYLVTGEFDELRMHEKLAALPILEGRILSAWNTLAERDILFNSEMPRLLLRDEGWLAAIRELAQTSTAIIIELAFLTAGIRQELGILKDDGIKDKVIVVLHRRSVLDKHSSDQIIKQFELSSTAQQLEYADAPEHVMWLRRTFRRVLYAGDTDLLENINELMSDRFDLSR